MSAHLPAEAGCETWESETCECSTIGLYCVTITCQQQFFKGSLEVAAMGALPHVTVKRRHLGK